MKRYFVSSRGASAATALSATSGPTPVTSPREMPIQFFIVPRDTAISEVADEGLFLQTVNPLFFQLGLLLDAERFLDVGADIGERLGVRGHFVLDEHEIDGVGRVNRIAHLAGLEREGDIAEFLAENGAFDPVPFTAFMLLRALRINGGHLGERRA